MNATRWKRYNTTNCSKEIANKKARCCSLTPIVAASFVFFFQKNKDIADSGNPVY